MQLKSNKDFVTLQNEYLMETFNDFNFISCFTWHKIWSVGRTRKLIYFEIQSNVIWYISNDINPNYLIFKNTLIVFQIISFLIIVTCFVWVRNLGWIKNLYCKMYYEKDLYSWVLTGFRFLHFKPPVSVIFIDIVTV